MSQSNSVAVNTFITRGQDTGYPGMINLHPCNHFFPTFKKTFLFDNTGLSGDFALLRVCGGERRHRCAKDDGLVNSKNHRWSSEDSS